MSNMDDDRLLFPSAGWLKTIIVTDLRDIALDNRRNLGALLKYLQYYDGPRRLQGCKTHCNSQDNPSVYSKGLKPIWIDRGLGRTHERILEYLFELQGRSLLARIWSIAPDPDLMQYVPQRCWLDTVSRMTDTIVKRWCEGNEWYTLEYSYVVHELRNSGDCLLHTHVVTPGTLPIGDDGWLFKRGDHCINLPHIFSLQRISTDALEEELNDILGEDQTQKLLQGRDEWQMAKSRYINGDCSQEWLMQKFAECWPDPIVILEESRRQKRPATKV